MLTRVLFVFVLVCGTAFASSAQETTVVALGVTDHAVTEEELLEGAELATPKFNTGGVAYAYIAHAKKGDRVEVHLTKDGTSLQHNVRELEVDEDGVLLQAGKSGVPAGGWPDGAYAASVTVTRGGKPVLQEMSEPIPFE